MRRTAIRLVHRVVAHLLDSDVADFHVQLFGKQECPRHGTISPDIVDGILALCEVFGPVADLNVTCGRDLMFRWEAEPPL